MKKQEPKTMTLPSGSKAEIREPKWKDVRIAGRHANAATDQAGFASALISQVAKIDGKPVTPEDVDELSLVDVNALLEEIDLGKSQIGGMSLPSPLSPGGGKPS